MGSLRERLRNRPLPSMPYRLLVDADAAAQAQTALSKTEQNLRQATLAVNPDAEDAQARQERYEKAQEAVQQAQEMLDACYETITLTALPPLDYEALRALHPAKPRPDVYTGQIPADADDVDSETFRPALLAACASGDMTEQDWAAFLAENVSAGEGQALYVAVLAINDSPRALEPSLGKDWTRMLG